MTSITEITRKKLKRKKRKGVNLKNLARRMRRKNIGKSTTVQQSIFLLIKYFKQALQGNHKTCSRRGTQARPRQAIGRQRGQNESETEDWVG